MRKLVSEAGYIAALAMDDADEKFPGESENLLAIESFKQSRLDELVDRALGGNPIICSPKS